MTDRQLLEVFEQRFRAHPDPWATLTSDYEIAKRATTVTSCGSLDGARVLELGAANGVLAADLASHAAELTAIEAVPAAAALARERLQPFPHARVVEGMLPDAVPPERYDVIVASEILYYLEPAAYATTLLERLERWLAPGGRLVAVHWRPGGPERPRSSAEVHADLSRLPFLRTRLRADREDYLLSVLERV